MVTHSEAACEAVAGQCLKPRKGFTYLGSKTSLPHGGRVGVWECGHDEAMVG